MKFYNLGHKTFETDFSCHRNIKQLYFSSVVYSSLLRIYQPRYLVRTKYKAQFFVRLELARAVRKSEDFVSVVQTE